MERAESGEEKQAEQRTRRRRRGGTVAVRPRKSGQRAFLGRTFQKVYFKNRESLNSRNMELPESDVRTCGLHPKTEQEDMVIYIQEDLIRVRLVEREKPKLTGKKLVDLVS